MMIRGTSAGAARLVKRSTGVALMALLSTSCASTASAPAVRPTAARAPAVEASTGQGEAAMSVDPGVERAAAPAPAARSRELPPNPSCTGQSGAGNDCQGGSCCARSEIPGGTFTLRTDQGKAVANVHVATFVLDQHEVTVGRVRAWVAAGRPTPRLGEVLYRDEQGHQVTWGQFSVVQTEAQLKGWERYDTWSGGDEHRPKNFVTWYTAAAFCHWNGGRLPTDTEWKYATVGGDEQRPYPWGTDEPTPGHAVFNCMGDGTIACSLSDLLPVGSRPRGDGRWGQHDLAGSLFEWTLDAQATSDQDATSRGGGFCYIGGVDRRARTGLRPEVTRRDPPGTVSHMVGMRCAYDLPSEAPTFASR